MSKTIEVVTKILDANARIANELRHLFQHANVLVINVISSPGAGKTTLLEHTCPALLKRGIRAGVIAADIATTADAERLARHNIPVVQITTETFGGACHLEAPTVLSAIDNFPLDDLDLIFVENVGNLVCPAEFDIGEALRVTLLSVTEGEDKPLKYPLAFRVSECALVMKMDLVPHLDISLDKLRNCITQINPQATRIELATKTGSGMEQWLDWLTAMHDRKAELLAHHHDHDSDHGSGHHHGQTHGHTHSH